MILPLLKKHLPALVAALLCTAAPALASADADLMVGYAPSYATSVGGEDNAQVIFANAIAGSNAINDKSGTGARMRIIGFHQSAQDNYQASSLGGYVGWLSGYDSRVSDVVDAGNAVGADLVTYVCEPASGETAAAVAQQPGRYSSISPSAFWSAIIAHEIGGHNYGRSHSDGILNPKTVMLHNYCGGGAAPPYLFTNPNIWFNGVRLLGTGDNCSMGSVINGGNNSQPTYDSAQGVADRYDPVIVGPNLSHVVHHWSFNQAAGSAPTGTAVGDQVSGGGDAVVRGNGAIFTGTGLRIPGGTTGNVDGNSIAAYIDLPNGIVSSNTNITIEVWATPLSAPSWARILDFGRPSQAGDGLGASGEYTGTTGSPAPGSTTGQSGIMLSADEDTNLSLQRLQMQNRGASAYLDSGLPTVAGVQHHYAITFTNTTSGGRLQWYRDGDAVAYVDVLYHLSNISDVNNWLGRSMYSADSMANNEYAEVRISNVAMSRSEVLANYLLGPNYDPSAKVLLTGNDASGTTSFTAAGNWNNASAPSSAAAYDTLGYTLRTPESTSSQAFAGSALDVSGGRLLYKGTLRPTLTIHGLTLRNGVVTHGGSGTCTLAGEVIIDPEGGRFLGQNGAFTITSSISGSGPVTYVGNTTTLSGTNTAFTGKTLVGDGSAGTLSIGSEDRLGVAPATLVADQLDLNRGTLQTTATMSLDDPTRGILLDVGGGTFNVNTGTTLTVACPLSSPYVSGTIYEGAIGKTGGGTLILASTSSSFNGNVYVDTGSTTAADGIFRVASAAALANAHSPIYISNNNSGSSRLQLDGSTESITLPQSVSVAGRTNASVAIENLLGGNSLGGLTIGSGGSYYILQSDAGALTVTGAITSSTTGARSITLQGAGDLALLGAITNGSADSVSLAKNGSGTLTLGGASIYTGTTLINAGALKLTGSLSTTGAVTIGVSATLTGNGSTSAPVTVYGTHQPGNLAGTQILSGSLTYGAAATLDWTLLANSTATASAGRVAGSTVTVSSGAKLNVTLNRVGSAVSFADSFWTQSHSWTVLTGSAISGTFTLGTVSADASGVAADGLGTFALDQTATTVVLTFTPTGGLAAWRQAHFGADAGNALVSGDAVDVDSDGLPNLLEYALGSDPVVQSPGAVPVAANVGGRLTLNFSRNTAATDVTLVVEATDDLAGTWTEIARSTAGAAFTVSATGATVEETGSGATRTVAVGDIYLVTDAAHPKRFLRLRVEP